MKHIIDHSLVGSWELVTWQYFVNGEERSFWKDPVGMLVYTKENTMSAVLMMKDRQHFSEPFIAKGSTHEKISAINGYISYAGSYSIDKEKVYHRVKYSLLPNWIGTTLERYYHFSNDDHFLTLMSIPVTTESGKEIKNILTWRRL